MQVGDKVRFKDNAYYYIDSENSEKFKPGNIVTVSDYTLGNRGDVYITFDNEEFDYYMFADEVESI